MSFKDRVRRAMKGSSPDSTHTSSTISSASTSHTNLPNILTTTPTNVPDITLTKTPSRLSRITSWKRERKEKPWKEPKTKYPGAVNAKHQEMLRGFEMKFGRQGRPSLEGRWSMFSGVSPMASRRTSIDEATGVQKASGLGGLPSRQASRDEGVGAVVKEDM